MPSRFLTSQEYLVVQRLGILLCKDMRRQVESRREARSVTSYGRAGYATVFFVETKREGDSTRSGLRLSDRNDVSISGTEEGLKFASYLDLVLEFALPHSKY